MVPLFTVLDADLGKIEMFVIAIKVRMCFFVELDQLDRCLAHHTCWDMHGYF